jgi:hypothetical protein
MSQYKQKNVKIRASDQHEETGSRTEWVNGTGREFSSTSGWRKGYGHCTTRRGYITKVNG